MKIVGWIFVAIAGGFLLFILYFGFKFLLYSSFSTEAKILSCFLAFLAFGTTIGRFAYLIKDLKNNSKNDTQH